MKIALLRIKDEVNVKIEGLELTTRRKLQNRFKFEVPYARHMPAVKLGRWDGKVAFFQLGGSTYINLLPDIIPILEDEGYEVTGVDTGTEALKVLNQESFEVMLSDFRLPDLNGLELFEKVAPYHPAMKTIILTAYSTIKDAVEAMKKAYATAHPRSGSKK